jgi:hypothetical protein
MSDADVSDLKYSLAVTVASLLFAYLVHQAARRKMMVSAARRAWTRVHIAQRQADSMAFQEAQDAAHEFRSAVQIVSRPPDHFFDCGPAA